ncbi:MAG: 1,2-phenylacetyl-CoA epoxidase subunit PaaC [Halobacteriota archaeon]
MTDTTQYEMDTATTEFLLAIADDEYFTGHRLGMWLAVSPTLEEDNTLTSIAQDELGHARLWYDIVAEQLETTTDELAIERGAADRRNSILVEREHADFADTVTRNYLYDEAERLILESIRDGSDRRLSDTAAVALNEEPFHLEHADRWFDILESTDESRDRFERAFRRNLQAAADLFSFETDPLVESGVLAQGPAEMSAEWEAAVTDTVATLSIDVTGEEVAATASTSPETNGRAGEHTDDLAALIADMRPREIERI